MGKPLGKHTLVRRRRNLEGKNKMQLRIAGCDDAKCMKLAQYCFNINGVEHSAIEVVVSTWTRLRNSDFRYITWGS